MTKRRDLTGQTFSHLTVIELDEEKTKKSGRESWVVECDCSLHTRFTVFGSNLKRGNTTKCQYCKAKNLINQKFGHLTIIDKIIDDKNHIRWKAKCDCGNIIIVRGDSLKSGHTRSCGCLQKHFVSQLKAKNLVGQKFGKLTVVKESSRRDSSGNKYWICNCDCGTTNHEVSGHHLTQGNIMSCGCSRSHGEEKIAMLLHNASIPFKREYLIKDFLLSTGGKPRFDFAILNDKDEVLYFIEYHGEQHYSARGHIFTKEHVKIIQQRDKEKTQYCNDNNIPLIVIPYTKYKNLTLNDLILQNTKNTKSEHKND